MTVSVILFLSAFSLGIGLAVVLARRPRATDQLPDSKTLEAEVARLERYNCFTLSDCANASQCRRLVRQQLIELRRDFLRFSHICRLLAPYSDDPELGTVVLKQLLVFHGLWAFLWIGTYSRAFEGTVQQFTRLVDSVKVLRTYAHDVTEGAERAALGSRAL